MQSLKGFGFRDSAPSKNLRLTVELKGHSDLILALVVSPTVHICCVIKLKIKFTFPAFHDSRSPLVLMNSTTPSPTTTATRLILPYGSPVQL